jgi:branched-chain amino acid transport system substrate-binding protein
LAAAGGASAVSGTAGKGLTATGGAGAGTADAGGDAGTGTTVLGGSPGSTGAGAGVAGSGSSTGPGGQAQAGGSSANAALAAGKKSPVSIAALGAFSGVVGATQAPNLAALRAWIRFINDHGGLNGHPVNPLIVADDGGDSARNKQLAQQLVEQDNVVALVFDAALDASGTVSYVTSKGVPFIGGIGTGQYFYESPVYFPQMAQGLALAQAVQGAFPDLVKQGKPKVGVLVCAESPRVCNAMIAAAKNTASRYGAQVVYSATASIVQPDYSAECLNARNAGAQAIWLGFDVASNIRVAQSCARQGYHPVFATTAGTVSPDMAKDPNFDGMIVVAPTMPVAADSPALTEFRAAMAKYAPSTKLVDGHVYAWAIGKILELGAKGLPDGDTASLRKALLQGLGSIPPGQDIGITMPLNYNVGKPSSPNVCWFIETVTNSRYASNGQRSCVAYDPAVTP